ncbi:hypothetical protein MKX03_007543 [Papaver bracteatum]|nr:hypothetical protein MKX03_007543 [Papaver bracteatum]
MAKLEIAAESDAELNIENKLKQLQFEFLDRGVLTLLKNWLEPLPDGKTAGIIKLAKDLIDKWSRPIFNKSTRFKDSMKYNEDGRVLCRRPMVKNKIDKAVILYSRDDDVDEFTMQRNSGESSSNQHTSRPEASPMDFNVRPQSSQEQKVCKLDKSLYPDTQQHYSNFSSFQVSFLMNCNLFLDQNLYDSFGFFFKYCLLLFLLL